MALRSLSLALRRSRADGRARDRLRRRLPAAEVRRRPRARLRPDGPLRAGADRAPAVDTSPTSRRLWQRRPSLSTRTPGALTPRLFVVSARERTPPTPGRSRSSRSLGEGADRRAGAVHDGLRLRDRRGADLGQRAAEPTGPGRSDRASGRSSHERHLRVGARRRCSGCAGLSATRGRSTQATAGDVVSSPAASASRRCVRSVLRALDHRRDYGDGDAALRRAHAGRSPLSGAARRVAQRDRRRGHRRRRSRRLVRPRRRRAEAGRGRGFRSRRRRRRSSAARRS